MRKIIPDPETGFPKGLSQPALRALNGAGYTQLQQLTGVTETAIQQLHGMGEKGMVVLRQALADKGWAFKTNPG
ncbi:hypothetical protein [Chitinophaga nivalis]|uniref:DNA-binding protein n=1 Tax=Chitinophaga nivalis TaxID=2991709 RepID=A0ABT3IL45_9BACT|nr:hypothetical protein [Chitinophaga nivalis]MCW3465799.1 hypothetical protein [Chitinophaga nivalis]MCW3484510.1 hypothetical protein [Chitinophaga nivalis]